MENNQILNSAINIWRIKTKNISIPSFEKEDLEQDFLIRVLQKIRDNYDESKSQINTYISRIADNHIKNLFRSASQYKNVMRYTAESLDAVYTSDNYSGDETVLLNIDVYCHSTEEGYSEVELKEYIKALKLSAKEELVVNYLMKGYSKSDIAQKLNVSNARISNIINQIKNKLEGEYDRYATSNV